ncbi:LAGLIDADG family homing endonuclease [Candidatus Nomurabacteria bacterium]|nr:LAGLIDADG family homing endonuclease [Candidatus Nomurabacteria bacterium]
MPAKSKKLATLKISDEYFFDFLRGYFDGDGCSYSYYDPLFPNSYRFYISFISASPPFLEWLQAELTLLTGVKGSMQKYKDRSYVQLRFSKKEAVVLSQNMYYRTDVPCLRRKYLKVKKSLDVINSRRSGEIGRHATFRS